MLIHVLGAISFIFSVGQNISIYPNLKGPDLIKEKMIAAHQDFIEINLEEMIIKHHKRGEIIKTFDILKKGSFDSWGGLPSGLYFADFKSKIAYSSIAHVYMPWSIKIFGKYYIHGGPYYPSGKKLETIHSGGCIQLLNEDARMPFESIQKGTPILIVDKKNNNYDYQKPKTPLPAIPVASYLIADIDSGHIFSSKNANNQFSIASLTKLMTAIVAVESVDLRRSIQVKEKMLKTYGSIDGLAIGKNFGAVEILYPLLVSSSNGASEAVASLLGREKTIKLMNEKTRSIMMGNTEFVDVSGMNQENKSTAKDLFYLARYIFNNRFPLLKITKGEAVDFSRGAEKKWQNNKNLFFKDKNFIGGKTGYIKESGHVGVFLFQFSDKNDQKRNIVVIVLGANNLDKSEDGLKPIVQRTVKWLEENYFN